MDLRVLSVLAGGRELRKVLQKCRDVGLLLVLRHRLSSGPGNFGAAESGGESRADLADGIRRISELVHCIACTSAGN